MSFDPTELVLTESGAAVVRHLSAGQFAALAARDDLVSLAPAASGAWRIGGRRKVGAVVLGQGAEALRLRIRPKLTVERLLFLAGFAKNLDVWNRASLNADRDAGLETVFARLYADAAQRALGQGILQGYTPVAEEDTVVRGRIDSAAQIRRFGMPIPVSVVYDDYTTDIAENQILLTAARRCASLRGLDGQTRTVLRHLESKLVGVRVLPFGAARPSWQPNRLNLHCQQALRLAELILDATTPDPLRTGPVAVNGFVLDMARIFEDFLTRSFEAALSRHGCQVAAQQARHRLDEASRIPLRPDMSVYRRGRLVGVIDAKYKTLTGGRPPNEDLYQLTAYCTALGVGHGHLVYASGAPAATRHDIRRTAIAVTAHALDLAAPVPELVARIDHIAGEMAQSAVSAQR